MEWQRCTLRTAIQTPRPGSAPCRAGPAAGAVVVIEEACGARPAAVRDGLRAGVGCGLASRGLARQPGRRAGPDQAVLQVPQQAVQVNRGRAGGADAGQRVFCASSTSSRNVRVTKGPQVNPDRALHRTYAVAISVKARHGGNAQIQDGLEHTGRAPGDAEGPALRYSWPAMGFYNPHRR